MGLQIESKINATNAFLYCMKMVALFNPEVDKKLTEYREKLAKEVEEKDARLVQEQIDS
jgi:phosphoribosylcarboxyaminoimidazole (NCAIR) mutase